MSYLQHIAHTFVFIYSSHELYKTVQKKCSPQGLARIKPAQPKVTIKLELEILLG